MAMKEVFLHRFKCDIDNDGDDSDSPYVIAFVGFPDLDFQSEMNAIYLNQFDDTVASTGAWTQVDLGIWTAEPSSLFLVALLERDDGIDLTGDELSQLKARMAKKFVELAKKDHLHGERLVKKMIKEFRRSINAHTNNDDLIGVRHLPIPASGKSIELRFENGPDAGSYVLDFRVVDT